MREFGINQGSIARRLFVQILLLSLMATIIISALQLHFRYRDKLRGIAEEIQRIEVSRLNSMAVNLWNMDETLLRVELEGIMNLPNIQFVEVRGNEGLRIARGIPGAVNRFEREYPLVFSHRGIETEIGKFRIQANLDRIWTEFLEDAAVLSLGEAGKVFVIAFLVFVLFQITVGRHLRSLALQARNLDIGRPHSPFDLDRPSRQGKKADDLEYLVSALNRMNAQLMGTIENLQQTNEKLDQEIGERKNAESVSHERELRLRLLTENMVDAISQVDARRLICYCSPSVERVFGIKPEDLIGHSAYGRVHPEDIERMSQQALEAIASHAASLRNEYRYLHGCGEYVWVESSVRLLYGESGDYDGAIIGSRDITGRKRAEDGLRQANLVVENSPVVLFRWKAAEGWPVEMVSQNVSQFGYAPEELLSGAVLFASMVHPEDLDRVGREVQEYAASGIDRFHQEYRMITKDGGVRWVDDRTVVERNTDGQIVFYQGIVIDITKRKLAEDALRESEVRFRAVFSQASVGMVRADTQGRLLEVNAAFASMLGMSREELQGSVARALTHPEDWPREQATVKDMLVRGDSSCRMEKRYLRPDGSVVWVDLSVFTVRTTDTDPILLIGMTTDITDRKRAEVALRSSLVEKESLLKEVHHRVKNNLQIISSLLNLQGRQVQNPEVHAFLRDTQNRVRSMALLHETLYRSGNLAKVSFPQYVKSVCAHLARSYASGSERIRLRHDIADMDLEMDQAIPAGLIISELVANAFKHAFPSGSRGEILVVFQAAGEHHVVLRISDNGVGLPAEISPQSAETLGLILVRNLSRQLDGRMSITSEQGSVFEIVFPAQSTRKIHLKGESNEADPYPDR